MILIKCNYYRFTYKILFQFHRQAVASHQSTQQ